MIVILQLLSLGIFCLIHVYAGKLRFLDSLPRSGWLSFAGGVSVAYIFLHVFPELASIQEHFSDHNLFSGVVHSQVYLLALLGLVIFYGLEKLAKASSASGGESSEGGFMLHLSAFALYNALIGYLLVHREDPSLAGLGYYVLAMGLHFLVNDYGLRQHHKDRYRRYGRWILAAAILAGFGVGTFTHINANLMHGLFAFLAGSIVLNVLKEELPEERQSRFVPFLGGSTVFAVLSYLH